MTFSLVVDEWSGAGSNRRPSAFQVGGHTDSLTVGGLPPGGNGASTTERDHSDASLPSCAVLRSRRRRFAPSRPPHTRRACGPDGATRSSAPGQWPESEVRWRMSSPGLLGCFVGRRAVPRAFGEGLTTAFAAFLILEIVGRVLLGHWATLPMIAVSI